MRKLAVEQLRNLVHCSGNKMWQFADLQHFKRANEAGEPVSRKKGTPI